MTFGQTFKHLPMWKLPDAPNLLTSATASSAKQPILPFWHILSWNEPLAALIQKSHCHGPVLYVYPSTWLFCVPPHGPESPLPVALLSRDSSRCTWARVCNKPLNSCGHWLHCGVLTSIIFPGRDLQTQVWASQSRALKKLNKRKSCS